MKKIGLFLMAFVWLFLFSFDSQASFGTPKISSTPQIQEKEMPKMEMLKSEEAKPELSVPAELAVESKQDKEEREKAEQEEKAEKKELLLLREEWLRNGKNDLAVDKIGSLTLSEGMGKRRVKLFAGTKKLVGKADKENQVFLTYYRVGKEKEVEIIWKEEWEIGASGIFSTEISLEEVGTYYLLIQVKQAGKTAYQLYQVMIEDSKMKDRLERLTLQFLK